MREFTTNPYRTDLSPEQRARLLITALREMEPGKIYHVAGDGEFFWDYGTVLERAEDVLFDNDDGIPEGFCGTVGCAAGLGHLLGLIKESEPFSEEIANELDISEEAAERIFFDAAAYPVTWEKVTPAQVADALEAELARSAETP